MELQRGKNYVVRYNISGVSRKDQELCATFLYEKEDELIFSGRPLFGTTPVKTKHVIEARTTTETPFLPRIYRG